MKKIAITATLLLCLLTACGATDAADLSGPGGGNAVQDRPPGQESAQNPEAVPETGTAESAPAPEASQNYYMNKNYIIKPKSDDVDGKIALLTFDDGPKDAEVLQSILDTLDKYEAKAIFFINGYRAEVKPELVKLMHSRGHSIGNHSWDHIDLKKEEDAEAIRQITEVQRLVKEITGEAPGFFRPPFGSGGDVVKQAAKEAGMLYMTWSNGSRDWMDGYDITDKIIESVLEQLHPGSNILMHELPWTADALDPLLSALQDKGYRFVHPKEIDPDVSEM